MTINFHIPNIAPLTYEFVLDQKVLKNDTFKYKFYDVSDQKIKDAKIYSPFNHFKNNGFFFRVVGTAASANSVSIEFLDDNKKIKTTFFQDDAIKWAHGNSLYRDLNVILIRNKEGNNFKWYGAYPKLIYRTAGYAMDVTSFHTSEFLKYFYVDKKLGKNFYVVGTPLQRLFLPNNKKHLQPFIKYVNRIEIRKNEGFFIPGVPERQENVFTNSILEKCKWLGTHVLTDNDRTQLNALYPKFSFNHLSEYELQKDGALNWWQDDVQLFPKTQYHKFGLIKRKDFRKFESKNNKYKDWLTSDWGVFFEPSIIGIPDTLKKCEELFDEKVLEIKKLVEDIGDLNVVISDKQLNLILYDDSNIIAPTYTQRFNKHLQIYGFISIP